MPKKNPKGIDNSGSVERDDYNNYNNLDINNDPTHNRIVAEDGRMGNILLDLTGGYVTNEDPTLSDENSSTS